MVMYTGMVPIVGEVLNRPVNLLFSTQNNRSIVSSNVESVGTSGTTGDPNVVIEPTTWPTIQVDAIYADGAEVLALGTATDSNKATKKLAWTNKSGNWVIGQAPVDQIRPVGIEDNSGFFLVADSNMQGVIRSKFNYAGSPTPAGGFNDILPTYEVVNSRGAIDSLSNNGTTTVGASLTTIGTWVTDSTIAGGGDWSHQVGVAELILTNNRATSYTFPGAAGNTQIQRANAIPYGDSHPVNWDIDNTVAQGYYGPIGGTHGYTGTYLTVSWVET